MLPSLVTLNTLSVDICNSADSVMQAKK